MLWDCKIYIQRYIIIKVSVDFPTAATPAEPGCFVPELVETGLFSRGRYQRYIMLYRELKEREKYKYK